VSLSNISDELRMICTTAIAKTSVADGAREISPSYSEASRIEVTLQIITPLLQKPPQMIN